jgi:hypothetical protein
MLHCAGVVLWHDARVLRDVVIIDPLWLATSMACVVTFINEMKFPDGILDGNQLQQCLQRK